MAAPSFHPTHAGSAKPPLGVRTLNPQLPAPVAAILLQEVGGATVADILRPGIQGAVSGAVWCGSPGGGGIRTAAGQYVAFTSAPGAYSFTGDQTLLARIYWDGSGSGTARRIVTRPAGVAGYAEWLLCLNAANRWEWAVTDTSLNTRRASSGDGVMPGWHLLVGRIRVGGGLDLFVDGLRTPGDAWAGTRKTDGSRLFLGRFDDVYSEPFSGVIECLMIWDQALSDGAIVNLTVHPYSVFSAPRRPGRSGIITTYGESLVLSQRAASADGSNRTAYGDAVERSGG
ncbi:MAG: LamG-like jellyroll fold domain-containing protein [Chthonomonadales bacterium]